MSDFEIRAANGSDVPVLLALIRELAEYEKLTDKVVVSEDDLRRWLFGERPVAEAVLGCWQEAPVAYAVFYPTLSTFSGEAGLYLEDLYVRKDYRGRGCGGELLRHVARIAHRLGFRRISWAVLDWNEAAIGFYRHLGAQPAAQDWLIYALDAESVLRLASSSEGCGAEI